jgi:hypothetical protein
MKGIIELGSLLKLVSYLPFVSIDGVEGGNGFALCFSS